MEEAPRIEGCANPNIQDKYRLTTKTTVDYADMLLPLTKIMWGKKKNLSFQGLAQWKNMKASLV